MLDSENSFVDLGLNTYIVDMLSNIGYQAPLPIQTQCIPLLLKGCDLLGMAHTGSGKTAAFLLPLLQNIDIKQRFVQGLIIVPTRELAIQIGHVCMYFIKSLSHIINIAVLYGGQNYRIQFNDLKKNPHIIIGTPGRLLDHLSRGLDISKLKTLIIDEADEMLRMGFIEDIEHIIRYVPTHRQTALFSATLPVSIRKLSYKFMCNPKEIYINPSISACADIKQSYWLVHGISKHEALMRFLEVEKFEAVIIFVRTKSATLQISEILQRFGYNSAALNGDMNQSVRCKTISRLRCGTLDILITTDVAARGLDINRISFVINYDIPCNYNAYVHRIGRTGRAGRSGKSLLFVERQEYHLFNYVIKRRVLNSNIVKVKCPTSNDLVRCRLKKFTDKVVNNLESKDIEQYQSLLGKIKIDLDITIEKLAAILLKIAQGSQSLIISSDDQRINKKIIYYNKSDLKKNSAHKNKSYFVHSRRSIKCSNVYYKKK
ncbi:Cold-shock DEAD-box protein A, inducible ATP-independent RNA helicase [Candidatus Blochmanniella floridana]|uniref:Cold-shock DEAD-box protein A, inducible ATP-independent RNA helicase n=1 Tax=Blochmanniella floridana TaxID=203907 RepID=Q7VQL9_BLOFL|nr:Cold-shock DEAD-box protein A, inducible ATP-independent RNA helicase [Candidatus Blochmannia floridanus]